jgi:hypothetical protein
MKTMISIDEARAIVELRLAQARENALEPSPDFIRRLVELGCLPRPCSRTLMYRLLSGRLYPDLTDPAGQPYQWEEVSRSSRGRPRRPSHLPSTSERLQILESQLLEVRKLLGLAAADE